MANCSISTSVYVPVQLTKKVQEGERERERAAKKRRT